jgi:hypothetical protein
MDLFDELRKLIEALGKASLDYALCGGFALAAHGIVRATEDIDLMLEEGDLAKLRGAVEPIGFWLQPQPLLLKDGQVKIHRFVKTEASGPDFLVLDVLTVTPATKQAWDTRCPLETDFGTVPVISRAGLIHLKSLRASGQDLDDIQKLKAHGSGQD